MRFAAARGREAEHLEVAGGHAKRMQHYRLTGARELSIGSDDSGQTVESSIARAEIAKVERVQRKLRIAIAIEENADDAIGLRIRQRTQQHSLNHAEYGAVRADTERHGEHDDD